MTAHALRATVRASRSISRSRSLRLTPIATVCAGLLSVPLLSAAQTAPTKDEKLETVTVTGFRASLESSISAKRLSDSIVEAVSAEDIGKLPDASIADSIARLPGLAAQRIDGRPSAISIRGLGPDYSVGLLNGRQVVSSGDGRAAEYDQFPSELVGQVLVYKTPDAAVIGQGLAGTIDIRPVMPLSLGSRQMAVGARMERNSNGGLSSTGKGANGNRLSFSYIDQFADRTVGLSLGYAHLDSPGQEKKYEVWRYGDYVSKWGAGAQGVPAVGTAGDRAQFAQGFETSVTSSKQVRDGFMGVLEFKPNANFHSVADLYYSKFEQDRVAHHWVGDIGLWSSPAAAFSNTGTAVVNGNTLIASGSVANGHSLVYNKNFKRTDEITSLGWKNELKLSDKFSIDGDIGYSRSVRNENYIQSVARPVTNVGFSFSGLDATGQQSWSTTQDLTSSSVVKLTNDPDWAEQRTPHYRDEIKSLKLAGKYALDWGPLSGLEFGLAHNQRDKTVQSDAFRLQLASTNVDIPTAALRGPVSIDFGNIHQSILSWDVPSVMGLYTAVAKDPWSAKDNKYAVHEKVTTAFAKLDIDTKLGSVPLRGNVGLQAVRTQQNSDGVAWNDGSSGASTGTVIPVSGGTSYTDYLPSLNLIFNFTPNLVYRLGLAKTMARPRMDDMRAGADQPKLVANSVAVDEKYGHWTAGNGGKPDLQPWRAQSVDMSIEQYLGKRSYVALASFYKKLNSFVYQQTTTRDFSGFPNYSKTLVPGCSAAKPDCNPNLGDITTQANGEGGSVYGFEFSTSLDAGWLTPALDGFGIVASESLTRNRLPKDNNGNPINLDGFSGIVNSLALYYEKNGISARIGQRYRSSFTASTRSVLLGTETNTQIGAEKQIDLQLGYAFETGDLKGLSLTLQINNLTNASAVQTRGPEVVGSAGNSKGLLPWKVDNFGRVLLLGASYKF
ncbi:TonB-dependent receptor [Pelomonas sp. P7]|uniref:TonB-dependent receptor n=1 Tax=Pelomonas caseinilytica TaxID=2906763 RepID=A0ABS8XHX4_9BURK|nr:TonB-dependent receptor [Pelomonas sp. P7]MCE4539152.1 TonB-dependent receptor [Pelomonas sp. P7]